MDMNQPTSTPPVQPPAHLGTPELPRAPEKLLEPPPKGNGSLGAFIGIVIILLVLIVGALYFWGAKLAEEEDSFIPEEGYVE